MLNFNIFKSIQKPFNENIKCAKSVILLHFVINLFPSGQYGNASPYFTYVWKECIPLERDDSLQDAVTEDFIG